MRFTTLSAWLGWLEQNHPKEIDLGLERVRKVADRLGLIKSSAKIITVAGTNGKGSCVTACSGLLLAGGFSVGTYTSPHLINYNERIRIGGEPAPDEWICSAFEKIADAAAEISLTYFEYGTLAALEIFRQQRVDFIVLEVGLGGRLDAVNIIDPDVSIITTIALDHQDWLGDTRELIGREKAGILRQCKPFICADQDPPQSVIDIAQHLETHTYFINRDFSYRVDNHSWQWRGQASHGQTIELPPLQAPHLPLPSMAAALQAIFLLDIKLTADQIESALLHLELPGRFQKIYFRNREFIVDVAHNPAATKYLAERLNQDTHSGKTWGIVAMMADKDRPASLANLTGVIDKWCLLELQDIPRAASTHAIAQNLAELGCAVQMTGAISQLMDGIFSASSDHDRVLVFGSFYTVAAVLSYMSHHDSMSSRGML